MAQPLGFGINVIDELNRGSRAAARVKMGSLLNDLIFSNNALRLALVALLAKLDADAGVTDVNYTSTATVPAAVKAIDKR